MKPLQEFADFLADEANIRIAANPTELDAAYALRHQVFCVEQGIFANDIDDIDPVAITIVACVVSKVCDAHIVGTVRIHQTEPFHWIGSRLAVAAGWRRRAGLGAALIRMAVGTATARGCTRFLAHVQAQNVTMFESLHWQIVEACILHGRPHSLMQADLLRYTPILARADNISSAA